MKKLHLFDHSIRKKLWLLTSFLVVATIGSVTLLSSSITSRFITTEARHDLERNTQVLAERIDLVCNETAIFSKMAIADKESQDFSLYVKDGSFTEVQDIRRILASFVEPHTYIETLNLFYPAHALSFSSNYYLERSPYFRDHTAELDDLLTPTYREIWGIPFYSSKSSKYLMPYYRKIYYGKSGKELGLMESLIPVELFITTIDNSIFSEDGTLYIINDEGTVIVHEDETTILKRIDEKKLSFIMENLNTTSLFDNSILCHSQSVPKTDWIIVNEVPQALILIPSKQMKLNFLLIGAIALVFTVFFSYRLSLLITRPLIDMEQSISATENLEYRKYVPVSTEDEIGKLGRQYNHMIDRIAQAADFERKRDVQIKQYELALLQSQINPHFLNNILENICGLIELERKDDSISLIRDTADFYRSILSTDNLIITLEQELNIAALYIKIQNVRCNNRISFEMNVPERYMEKQIVKLTLQPIVENAIRHGMDLEGNILNICIDCESRKGSLIIRVHDTGVGMSENVLANILRTERKTQEGKPKHIGVYATDQRLKLHFGAQYGLQYKSTEGVGTTVEIHLPGEIRNE